MAHKETFFKEGCYIQEWYNSPADEDCSVARVRVEPHTQTRLHALTGITERYVILQGSGLAHVSGVEHRLDQGDVLTIAADEPQQIHNDGDDQLIFLAICTPRFQESLYTDLEDE